MTGQKMLHEGVFQGVQIPNHLSTLTPEVAILMWTAASVGEALPLCLF